MAGLKERLDELKKSFESRAPPYNPPRDAFETMHRATAELTATGLEGRALRVGHRAPNFTLFNHDQVQIDSTDLLRQGPPLVACFLNADYTIRPEPSETLRQLRTLSAAAAD